MDKKLNLLLGLALSLVIGVSLSLPTFAEPDTEPSAEPRTSDGIVSETTDSSDEALAPDQISEDETQDALVYIECRGNDARSYCSNEYVCFPNSDGTQGLTCAYAATKNDRLPETYCIEDENGERVCDHRDVFQNIVDEGTSGEGEVVCATPGEPGCEDSESELWPLVLSLSALGLTVLFVILINLFGRNRERA